jgi:nucleotide-binding universal stress UspA family protein
MKTVGSQARLKRILVTTDLSNEALRALPYAKTFAQRFGSEIGVLTVLELPSRFAGLESVTLLRSNDEVIGRLYGRLNTIASEADIPQAQVTTYIRTGKPVREIIKAARELEADLIIMATHGHTGLDHALLGSTTERVLREAPCPILAVRRTTRKEPRRLRKDFGLQPIVFATDFSENSLKALPMAETFAEAFDASIRLVHVVQKYPIDGMLGEDITHATSKPLMETAHARLTELSRPMQKQHHLKVGIEVRFGTPFDEITRAAKALDASMIVLATHGYTGLRHVFLGSVAERVVRHAHCPVLVVRERPK